MVILVVIMLVVGPSNLPKVTETVTRWIKRLRIQLTKWRANLDAEIGDDFKDVDLTKLDPRLYDPRRLIREAVQEEMDEWKKLMGPLGDQGSTKRPRPQNRPASTPSPAQRPTPSSPSVQPSSTGNVASAGTGSPASRPASNNPASNSSISEGGAWNSQARPRPRRRSVGGSMAPTNKTRARNLRKK